MVGLNVAISSVLLSSRLWSANPRMMDGYEFKVITAVVLGGTALEGGKGSVLNTVIASIFYCAISNAMTLYRIVTLKPQDFVKYTVHFDFYL